VRGARQPAERERQPAANDCQPAGIDEQSQDRGQQRLSAVAGEKRELHHTRKIPSRTAYINKKSKTERTESAERTGTTEEIPKGNIWQHLGSIWMLLMVIVYTTAPMTATYRQLKPIDTILQLQPQQKTIPKDPSWERHNDGHLPYSWGPLRRTQSGDAGVS
jgi:hypothetical protein